MFLLKTSNFIHNFNDNVDLKRQCKYITINKRSSGRYLYDIYYTCICIRYIYIYIYIHVYVHILTCIFIYTHIYIYILCLICVSGKDKIRQ